MPPRKTPPARKAAPPARKAAPPARKAPARRAVGRSPRASSSDPDEAPLLAAAPPVMEEWRWPPCAKDVWGRMGWNWAHLLAINYGRRAPPCREEALYVTARIWNFLNSLPCPDCRIHALAYFASNPPDARSGPLLQEWMWRFHNSVNARLNKPQFAFSDYLRLYASDIQMSNLRI